MSLCDILCTMESDLECYLKSAGVTNNTLAILQSEYITTKEVFLSLNDDHFTKLLSLGIKVGQHALLLKILHKDNQAVNRESMVTCCVC